MARGRTRDWLAPVLVSLLLNLGLFALMIHWIVVEFEPKKTLQKQVTATPESPTETPREEPIDEPPEPEEPDKGPLLPLMASEPWLTAPLAADDDLRVIPEAVPPGLFDFPQGPTAPGPPRHHGRRTGMGTTTPPPAPVPEVTVQPNEPESEPEPDVFPESLLAGLKKSGHLAVPAARLRLSGDLAKQIRDRIAENRLYPEEAIDLGLEGRTITRFRLDARGQVRDFEVLNEDDVDPLLVEGARRSIEAGAPYPVPQATVDGSLYLAVACWTDGQGTVKRLRMVEGTGRDAVDAVARDRARVACARKELGWHVVEFEHGFQVRIRAQGDQFGPTLVEDSLPTPWAKAVRAELANLSVSFATTAAIKIPITFRLTW